MFHVFFYNFSPFSLCLFLRAVPVGVVLVFVAFDFDLILA